MVGMPLHPIQRRPISFRPNAFLDLASDGSGIFVVQLFQFKELLVKIPVDTLVYYSIVHRPNASHEKNIGINKDCPSFHRQRLVCPSVAIIILEFAVGEYHLRFRVIFLQELFCGIIKLVLADDGDEILRQMSLFVVSVSIIYVYPWYTFSMTSLNEVIAINTPPVNKSI